MKRIILFLLFALAVKFSSGQATNPWLRTGNSINSNTNFLGTLDNRSLRIKTKNLIRMKIDSNGIFNYYGQFKINTDVLPSSETSSVQIGSDKVLVGNIASVANTPVFFEFLKSNGSGSAKTIRGSVGYLGATEMNLSSNMDYTGAIHKYYDPTVPASWCYVGTGTDIFGLQYVPANNTNTVDIYSNFGCRPFYVELYTQPATGQGINGFSRTNTAILSLDDLSNTAGSSNPKTTLSTTSTQFNANGAISYYFNRNANGGTLLASSNTSSGNSAYARLLAVSDVASASLFALSSGYTNSGILVQNTSILYSANGNGLSVGTANASYLKFWTNNVNRTTISSAGLVTWTSAYHVLSSGTSSAGTAPIKFVSGTNNTTPETGAMEYNGTNLFFTRTGTTRENILTTASVNTVSPTSPNRTISVVIDGVTYYISAKTTND